MSPTIESFFDPDTHTITHVAFDHVGGSAAVIDPVWDFDPKSGRTSTENAERVVRFIRDKQLKLEWILETHAHADHLSAAQYLRQELGGKIGIGANIGAVQGVFKDIFNLESNFAIDGSQFDHLFADQEVFAIGKLQAQVIAVPGHTPADVAYLIGDALFVGDTLFMPDTGTARCDFPGGDAHLLYQSIQRIFALPAQTRLFLCHDYAPTDREAQWQSTVAEQRQHNIHVHDGVSEAAFVAMRTQRDRTLDMPVLLTQSVQVNIRAGKLPPAEANGVQYLKTPLNIL